MLFSLAVPALAEGKDYTFSILVDGSASKKVELNSEFTVTLQLSRADGEDFDMYSMQDYICFDQNYLRLVDGSIRTYTTAENTTVFNASPLKFSAENYDRVFINRASSNPVPMSSGVTLVSFKLQAVALGTTEIKHNTTELFKEVMSMYSFDRQTATVEIVDKIREPLPFVDINENDWFYPEVEEAYYTGVFNGQTATLFMPYDNITRGQFAAVIHRMQGLPAHTYTGELYPDVPADFWCADNVYWATEAGVVLGYDDGYYRPQQQITRQQMIAMLWRYSGKPDSSVSLDDFADGDTVTAYARTAMAWAVETGIIKGTNDNTLNPHVFTYRAQAAVILMRYKAVMDSTQGGTV